MRYTIENIKKLLKEKHVETELLSSKYQNSKTKLLWKCKCGKEFERDIEHFIYQGSYYCADCAKIEQGLKSRCSKDEKLSKVVELGYKVLDETQYETTTSYLDIENSEGYRGNMKYTNIMNGRKISEFSTSNPFNIYNMNLFIQKEKIDCKIVKSERETCYDNITFTCCECGEEFETSWGRFKGKNARRCKKCSGSTDLKMLSEQEMVDEFNKHKYEVIESYYDGTMSSRFVVSDLNEYKTNVSFDSFKSSDKGIRPFINSNPYFKDNIGRYIEKNGLHTTFLKDETKTNKELWFKCGCGEKFKMGWGQFRDQHKTRRNKCTRSQSQMETLTEEWLIMNNFTIEKQVKFEGCKDRDYLKFDFKVDFGEYFILIEVDGEYHYKSIKGSDLKEQQRKDEIKNQFCKDNKIKLVRIPYWNYKGKKRNEYKNILSQQLND